MKRYVPMLVTILALMLAASSGWVLTHIMAAPEPAQGATEVALDARSLIALPALDAGEGWEMRIRVQNLGSTATHAVLTAYAASTGECPADGAPAIAVLCSGLIQPGLTWTWTQAALPPSTGAGLVRAWSDCPTNQGLPVDVPLAVEVERIRIVDAQVQAVSAYVGQTNWGGPDPQTGKYVYLAPWLTLVSTLILQNVGTTCTQVDIDYWPQGECARLATTRIAALAPAQAIRIDADAGQADFNGVAFIRSSQPLAAVIDHWTPSAAQFETFSAIPAGPAAGFGPLAYRTAQGWNATIHFQNVDTTANVIPAIAFHSYSGDRLTTAYPRLCAGDSDQIELKTYELLPSGMFSVRMLYAAGMVHLGNDARGQTMAYTAVTDPLAVAARVIGLPRLIKTEAATSRVTIQNLNPNPGVTRFAIELYDGQQLIDVLQDEIEINQSLLFDLNSLNYIPFGWQGSGIIRVMDSSSQAGYPALNVVVTEQHLTGMGDRSFAYEGVTVPLPLPPTPTPTPRPSATPTATATDTPGPTNTPLPPGTPSATPEPSPTPTRTTTPPPTATFTPSPTPTPRLVEVTILAPSNRSGYAFSRESVTSHLGEGHIYVGMDTSPATPLTYYGMLQFDLSPVPEGVKLRRASVELVGQNTRYLSPNAGGQWRMHLLDQAVDQNWTRLGYWHIYKSLIRATLSPTLTDEDLGVGRTNRFEFSAGQLSALEERLGSTRLASFRIDGVPSVARIRNIFDWSPGSTRGTTSFPRPALTIVYEVP